ncbi:MAG: hypothetical protein AB1Z98_06150 [Nannocystaceae bacterium]
MIRLENVGAPRSVPLATVELDRRSGVRLHPVYGAVELVDHVTAWVFEDGMVLAAVLRRSALSAGQILTSRAESPARQAALSETERHDVLHAAGLRPVSAHEDAIARWEVA